MEPVEAVRVAAPFHPTEFFHRMTQPLTGGRRTPAVRRTSTPPTSPRSSSPSRSPRGPRRPSGGPGASGTSPESSRRCRGARRRARRGAPAPRAGDRLVRRARPVAGPRVRAGPPRHRRALPDPGRTCPTRSPAGTCSAAADRAPARPWRSVSRCTRLAGAAPARRPRGTGPGPDPRARHPGHRRARAARRRDGLASSRRRRLPYPKQVEALQRGVDIWSPPPAG